MRAARATVATPPPPTSSLFRWPAAAENLVSTSSPKRSQRSQVSRLFPPAARRSQSRGCGELPTQQPTLLLPKMPTTSFTSTPLKSISLALLLTESAHWTTCSPTSSQTTDKSLSTRFLPRSFPFSPPPRTSGSKLPPNQTFLATFSLELLPRSLTKLTPTPARTQPTANLPFLPRWPSLTFSSLPL